MSEEEERFARIRAAIEQAGDIVSAALQKEEDAGRRWDYLIVAVPVKQKTTRVAMLSNVMPESLRYFIRFIEAAFNRATQEGHVLDDRKPKGEAS